MQKQDPKNFFVIISIYYSLSCFYIYIDFRLLEFCTFRSMYCENCERLLLYCIRVFVYKHRCKANFGIDDCYTVACTYSVRNVKW